MPLLAVTSLKYLDPRLGQCRRRCGRDPPTFMPAHLRAAMSQSALRNFARGRFQILGPQVHVGGFRLRVIPRQPEQQHAVLRERFCQRLCRKGIRSTNVGRGRVDGVFERAPVQPEITKGVAVICL